MAEVTADGRPQTAVIARRPAVASYVRTIGAIIWKDLRAELRSREVFSGMAVFALLVILIFNFALDIRTRRTPQVTAGVLWVTFTFAGTLGLQRSMAVEKDRGCLDGLLLAPVDRSALYFGKAIGGLLFMLLVEAVVLPLYSVLYSTDLFHAGLLAVVGLGSVGYAAVGTLLSAMSVHTRMRDVLLPILLFPVVLPVIVTAVKTSSRFLEGVPMVELWPGLNLLIAYDVIFTAAAFMLFDYVVEE